MGRIKSKDNEFFTCKQQNELHYIASLYNRKNQVLDFLIKNCQDGTINYLTYFDIYKLIHRELGLPIPEWINIYLETIIFI